MRDTKCREDDALGTTRITIVDLPGCTAQGRTHDSALRAATLTAEEYVLRERAVGRVIPELREMDDLFNDPAIKRARDEGAFLRTSASIPTIPIGKLRAPPF